MPVEQPDRSKQRSKDLEDQYEHLYPKMGRDFIHVDDFNAWLIIINARLAAAGFPPFPPIGNSKAVSKGLLYKTNIDAGNRTEFPDIVNMDE